MQIEIKTDDSYIEPKIIILTASITDEINNIVQKLSSENTQIISGIKNGKIEVLEQNDLIRIFSCNNKVLC